MTSRISFFVSNILNGIVCVTVVGGIAALVSATSAEAVESPIVGYVQVSPNDCQVEYLAQDNEIYTFWEDCPE